MEELQTISGTDIPLKTRGILYLCDFSNGVLTIIGEVLFDSVFNALQAYANIPNPESQMVSGKTYNDLIKKLHQLHSNMKDPKWLKMLGDSI